MTDKVYLVTAPDDVLLDGARMLLVDLTQEQTQLVSTALTQSNDIPTLIAYVWNNGDSSDWLLDKKHKSDVIVFNAESENQTVVGYMAAQPNSYYFGTLKSLHNANKSAIYNTDDCVTIIDKTLRNYE
jgi:hypothetical protein